MLRLVTAVSALALCATPVLAQTNTSVVPGGPSMTAPSATISNQASMQQSAAAQPTPVKAAPATVATAPTSAPAQIKSDKPMPEKTADAAPVKPAEHHHRMSMASRDQSSTAVGEREVNALNVLESQGYSSFSDVKPDGKMISAVADKDGKQVQVKVSEDGKVEPSI